MKFKIIAYNGSNRNSYVPAIGDKVIYGNSKGYFRTGFIQAVDHANQLVTITKDQPGLFASKTKTTLFSNITLDSSLASVRRGPRIGVRVSPPVTEEIHYSPIHSTAFNPVVKSLFRFQLEKDPGVETRVLMKCNQLDAQYVGGIYTLMTKPQSIALFQSELTLATQDPSFPYALIRLCQEGYLTQSQFTHAYTLGLAVHPKDCQEADKPNPHRTVTLRLVDAKVIDGWVQGTVRGISYYLKWDRLGSDKQAAKEQVLVSALKTTLERHQESALMLDRVYAEIETDILFEGNYTKAVDFSDRERFHRFSSITVGGAHFGYLPQETPREDKSPPVPVVPFRFYEALFDALQSELGVNADQRIHVAPVIGRFSIDQLSTDIGLRQRGVGLVTPSGWSKMDPVEIDGAMSSRLFETLHDLYHALKLIYYRDDLPESREIVDSLLTVADGWGKSNQVKWKMELTDFLDTETPLPQVKRRAYKDLLIVFLECSPPDQPIPERILKDFPPVQMLEAIGWNYKGDKLLPILNQPRVRQLLRGFLQFPDGDFTTFAEVVAASKAVQSVRKMMQDFSLQPNFSELDSMANRYQLVSMEQNMSKLKEKWYNSESVLSVDMKHAREVLDLLAGTPLNVDLASYPINTGFNYLCRILTGQSFRDFEENGYKQLFSDHDPELIPPSNSETLAYFDQRPEHSIAQFLAHREQFVV